MSKPLEMNPEIRDRWVAALRSGNYAQGRGHLKEDAGYCCLGVLCELAVADGIIGAAEKYEMWWEYGHSANYPPETVRVWAGLRSNDPVVRDNAAGISYELSKFNDGNEEIADIDGESCVSPHSFDQIADLIETGG